MTANPAPGLIESGTDQGTRGLLKLQPHHRTDGETEAQRGKRASPGPSGNPWGGGGWTSNSNKNPQVPQSYLLFTWCQVWYLNNLFRQAD